jgi:hypothetical protein
MRQARQLAQYRFRATFRHRWSGYLTLVLLVALVGGLAMGAIAGARRTQSSYPTYLASTNPSDIGLVTAVLNPAIGNGSGYNPSIIRQLAHLPHVERVASFVGIDIEPLLPNGAPIPGGSYLPVSAGNGSGSVSGEGFTVDQNTVVQGHEPNLARADQFVTLAETAHFYHWHLGQVIPMGIYTNAETEESGFGTIRVQPARRIDEKLVAIVVSPTSIVEDDADFSSGLGYFTPALTREVLPCCVNFTGTAIKVQDPSKNLSAVEVEVTRLSVQSSRLPLTAGPVAEIALGKTERALRPLSLALGVFGAIAGLAALLIAGQYLGRLLRQRSDEGDILRALGASPEMIMVDSLFGTFGAVIVGGLGAFGVAVALSPLAPLGPVRRVYPAPGVAIDSTVLAAGFAVLTLGLGGVAAWLAYRGAPHRVAARVRHQSTRRSPVGQAATASGLPVSAATGIRFAVESGSGRSAVPVRSAILGSALAVIVVVATVVFSASLDRLVSTPALYGWNWSYLLLGGGGSGDIPLHQANQLLNRDKQVAQWSGAYFALMPVNGQAVPVLGQQPGAAVQPPVLTGHDLQGPRQIVLGAQTLAQLHERLGQSVTLSAANGLSVRLRIVGTATFPAVGLSGLQHLEMGQGALVAEQLIPPALRNPFNDPLTGPEGIFIRIRTGANPTAALQSLITISKPLSNNANFGVYPSAVLRPAEIRNYRSMGTTPAILGASLGAGALVALGLTLLASVRRRRRDLALLKTLGFTRRQLFATVATQSTVAVAIGAVVGVPLGIVLGRSLWILFAKDIDAVASPSVPVVSIVLITLGALLLANLVAALPGRMAARTPTALLLQAE